MTSLPGHGRDCDCVGCCNLREALPRPPEQPSLGGLRAIVASQRTNIERLRIELASARRELEALRAAAEDRELHWLAGAGTPAPYYPGRVWSSQFGWTGPYHLVAITWVPYPVAHEVALPDVWVPAKRALCGEPWHGVAQLWPAATDVCAACVAKVQS